jgi:hypothetical protein
MSEKNEPLIIQSRQRWYDLHPTVSKSVKLLETFPMEVQKLIGEAIIRLAERQCRASDIMTDLRSLGPEKVLGIFKSKNKRRTYDADVTVHQAMNYLYALPEEERERIAEQIISLVSVIYDYLKLCQSYNTTTTPAEVRTLVERFILEGTQGGVIQLDAYRSSYRRARGPMPVARQDESLTEDAAGMRIREERM